MTPPRTTMFARSNKLPEGASHLAVDQASTVGTSEYRWFSPLHKEYAKDVSGAARQQ